LIFVAFITRANAAEYYDFTDPFMAEYEGFWTANNGAKGRVTAQIRPLSNNQYDGFILFSRARRSVAAFKLERTTAEKDGIKFGASSISQAGGDLLAASQTTCELRDGIISGTFSGDFGEGTFDARKFERKSPTLGAKPPKHAVVLTDLNNSNAWKNLTWPLSKEGILRAGKGNIVASEEMTNFRLHLEFRTPYMPVEEGQKRGNSGVYLQGKYEVQVLDSFGLYPLADNDCGGVYKVKAPLGNATLPPMEWQTYDITYVEGSGARPPRITVQHNGITVIERAEVPKELTDNGTGGGTSGGGFLMLQDHGNPVEFRNIWALPFFSAERVR
jgi:hypothetical protein